MPDLNSLGTTGTVPAAAADPAFAPPLAAGSAAGAAEPQRRQRILALDALRGIGAFSVLLYHYTFNYQRVIGHTSRPLFFFWSGQLGVQLFFIISGFVILMTLERTRKPIDFVRARFARLYPVYWAAIFVTLAVLTIFPLEARPVSLKRAIVDLTMFQSLMNVGHIDPVYWTLERELFFYVTMLLIFSIGQLRRAEYFLLALLVIANLQMHFLPAKSPLLVHHHGLASAVGKISLVLNLEYIYLFLIGMMIYRISKQPRPVYFLVLAASLVHGALQEPRYDFCAVLLFTALVFGAAKGVLWPLENRVLTFLGIISYSLYLTHQNIGYVVIHAIEGRGISSNIAISAAAIVAIGVGTFLTFCVERPSLRYLKVRHTPKAP